MKISPDTQVVLPWPHKLLWPNGSVGNRHAKNRVTKKAKNDAWGATLAAKAKGTKLHWVFHPKFRGPLPDKDNCIASVKAYQDGIALALGVNDRVLECTYEIGKRGDRVVVTLTGGDE